MQFNARKKSQGEIHLGTLLVVVRFRKLWHERLEKQSNTVKQEQRKHEIAFQLIGRCAPGNPAISDTSSYREHVLLANDSSNNQTTHTQVEHWLEPEAKLSQE